MPNTQQGEQTELERIRQLLELVMQENRELKKKIAALEGQKESQPMDTTSANPSAIAQALNPPRKRAKETSKPETQENKLDESDSSLKIALRA